MQHRNWKLHQKKGDKKRQVRKKGIVNWGERGKRLGEVILRSDDANS